MAEENKTRDTNVKTQLSLAAALFFSPLVQNMLKNNTWDITDKDKNFIRWYIKFGYITIIFWLITIAAGVSNYLWALDILSMTYTVSIFILLSLLIISIVSILSDISLLKSGTMDLQTYTVEGNRKEIIFKYIPIYNIYLRYQAHTFEKPNRRIKESIILRTIFLIICLTGSIRGSSIALIVIIFRVTSLVSDVDMLSTQTKQYINRIFFKNPEEIRWYVTGFLKYAGKSLIHLFKPSLPYSLDTELAQEKGIYSRIIDIKKNTDIIIEYIIGIIVYAWLPYLIKIDLTIRTYDAGFALLILRYITMAIQLKHLPHLPLAREIRALLKWIRYFFTKTSFTPNP